MKRKIYIPNFNQKNRYIIHAEVIPLQDAAEIENKGAVALMIKLGMMSSDGGKLHPQATVTRAETAKTIMKRSRNPRLSGS